jgi:hypothetical protein
MKTGDGSILKDGAVKTYQPQQNQKFVKTKNMAFLP